MPSRHQRRMRTIWIVITIIGVLSMLVFTILPLFSSVAPSAGF